MTLKGASPFTTRSFESTPVTASLKVTLSDVNAPTEEPFAGESVDTLGAANDAGGNKSSAARKASVRDRVI